MFIDFSDIFHDHNYDIINPKNGMYLLLIIFITVFIVANLSIPVNSIEFYIKKIKIFSVNIIFFFNYD